MRKREELPTNQLLCIVGASLANYYYERRHNVSYDGRAGRDFFDFFAGIFQFFFGGVFLAVQFTT